MARFHAPRGSWKPVDQLRVGFGHHTQDVPVTGSHIRLSRRVIDRCWTRHTQLEPKTPDNFRSSVPWGRQDAWTRTEHQNTKQRYVTIIPASLNETTLIVTKRQLQAGGCERRLPRRVSARESSCWRVLGFFFGLWGFFSANTRKTTGLTSR